MENNNLCTIYLVRHGESEANMNHVVQGHLDSPLTKKGREQARETAGILKGVNFSAIYSSDLVRAKHTAEIIKLERDLAIKTSKLLRERTFGVFEGQKGSDFRESLKDELAELDSLSSEERWKHRAHPSIETDEEIVSRFITYLREIAVAYPGEKVLVTTHGGPMRMLLVRLGWGTREDLSGGALKNAGYVVLGSDGVDFFVEEVVGVEKPA